MTSLASSTSTPNYIHYTLLSTLPHNTMTGDASVAQPEEASDQSTWLKGRDAGTTYMAWATNAKDYNEILETRKFLKNTVVDPKRFIISIKARSGDSFVWGGITLDADALHKVKAYPGLKDVMIEPKVKRY
jgi:hypothetical protein